MGTISRTASSGKAQSQSAEVKNQEILPALLRIAHVIQIGTFSKCTVAKYARRQ